MRWAEGWGRLAAPAGSAPAPVPCHQEHLWGQRQGTRVTATPALQCWHEALAIPSGPTNPTQQSCRPGLIGA